MSIRFGFVSTFPPTQCGLATFTASLHHALTESGIDQGWVVRLVDEPDTRSSPVVVAQLAPGDIAAIHSAAARLNECDVAIVQHEFGIYGGVDGQEVVPLLAALRVPSVVVLHTVLREPTEHQRTVLEAIVARADAVVTMSVTARDWLAASYAVDLGKVSIIAHGASDTLAPAGVRPPVRGRPPTVLTWGLLGPGKGIEWGIDALALLSDLSPMPRYIVAGQTHPKVLLRDGDRYVGSLRRQIRDLGLDAVVSLDGRYRDSTALGALIASADVVLLPYDSTSQVTSGVLIEAVAAGKPVIATTFPHAVEMLSGGGGLLVPHGDASAIADAVRRIVTRPRLAAQMSAAALTTSPTLMWPAIAQRYRDLATELIGAQVAA